MNTSPPWTLWKNRKEGTFPCANTYLMSKPMQTSQENCRAMSLKDADVNLFKKYRQTESGGIWKGHTPWPSGNHPRNGLAFQGRLTSQTESTEWRTDPTIISIGPKTRFWQNITSLRDKNTQPAPQPDKGCPRNPPADTHNMRGARQTCPFTSVHRLPGGASQGIQARERKEKGSVPERRK